MPNAGNSCNYSDRERFAVARHPPRRRAKEGSSELAWLRTRQFVRGPPACHPCLDIIKWNSEPGPSEFVVAAAVLGDVGASEGDNRIEQRDVVSQYGRRIPAALRPPL